MTLLATILLDAAANGGTDYTGTVIGSLAALLGGGNLIKMLTDKATMKQEIIGLREKVLEVSASKKAMKKDLEGKIDKAEKSLKEESEKKDQVLHARIDRVRDDNIKSYEKLEGKIDHLEKKYDDNTKTILDALKK